MKQDKTGKEKVIEKLRVDIAMLNKSHEEKIKKLKHDFEVRLANIEKIHQQQVETERNILIHSWRWRIGDFIVTAFDRIKDLYFKCIGLFSREKLKIELLNNKKVSDNRIDLKIKTTMRPSDSKSKPMIACIFDTFTYYCFKNEFNIISITPENYKYTFINYHIDAFFCESAWKGNQSSWRLHIGKLNEKKKDGLKQVLNECKNKKIPSIFWNKEDPVHFDYFFDDAKDFDCIFTTDKLTVPKYKQLANHQNVYALPFAAQEMIHNPIGSKERDGHVCFAGTHYNTKYAERILDMEMILKPAMNFGLDIYDRNYGVTGYEKIMYAFPEIYKPYIKGRLEYNEMLDIYKKYKIFLNINSVKYSPTMLSRRVFELLACGTPVISTYSEAIENLLGKDTVIMVENEQETKHYIERLLHDEHFWWGHSLRGMRKVIEEHTYHERTKTIFKLIDHELEDSKLPRFLIIIKIKSKEDIEYFQCILNNQTYSSFGVLFFYINSDFNALAINNQFADLMKSITWNITFEMTGLMKHVYAFKGHYSHIAIMNGKNFYGSNYLRDFVLAIKYSGALFLGKKSVYYYNSNKTIINLNKGSAYTFNESVFSASLVIEYNKFLELDDHNVFEGESFNLSHNGIFLIDPYNMLVNGRQADPDSRMFVQI